MRARERVKRRAEDVCRILVRAKKICEEPDGPYMYGDMIESDLEAVRRLAEEEDFPPYV